MIYFTAHTFKCVCHCRRAMFRVLGMYNFGLMKTFPIRTQSNQAYVYFFQTKLCSYLSGLKSKI